MARDPTDIVEQVSDSEAKPLVDRGTRVVELDGLRFLLVIAILFTHAGIGTGGWPAVDTFFVLSGFLIASILIADVHKPKALRTFLGRRVRRLLPAFLACVMVVSGLMLLNIVEVTGPADEPLRQGFWSLFYGANWYQLSTGAAYWSHFVTSPFGHLWSLSIEEQFYLAFPLIMIGLRRLSLGWKTVAMATLAVASAVWAIVLYDTGSSIDRVYYGTDTRAFALLASATAALLVAQPRVANWLRAHARLSTAVGVGALAAMTRISLVSGTTVWIYQGGLQLTTVLECLLVVSLAVGNPIIAPLLKLKPMVWAGERSYSIYLYHLPVFAFMPGSLTHPWRTLLVGTPIAIALGAVSYKYIEQPFLRTAPKPGQVATRRTALTFASIGVTLLLAGLGLLWAIPRSVQARETLEVSATPTVKPVLDGRTLTKVSSFAAATPTTIPPVQHLMVLGDSMAVTFAGRLQIPGMEIINNGEIGCPSLAMDSGELDGQWMTRPQHCIDWREKKWAADLPRADATLWMWGGWDLSNAKVDGKILNIGTPEYRTFLESELEKATTQLTADGRRLFITSALCFPSNRVPDIYQHALDVNMILQDFAETHDRVEYLPLIDIVCDGAKDVSLDGTLLRPDGTHFSEDAAKMVWKWVLPYLQGTKAG